MVIVLWLNFASIWRERMKALYALCFVTLLAVLVDVVLLHLTTANAQDTGNYKVVGVHNYGSFSPAGTVVVSPALAVNQTRRGATWLLRNSRSPVTLVAPTPVPEASRPPCQITFAGRHRYRC